MLGVTPLWVSRRPSRSTRLSKGLNRPTCLWRPLNISYTSTYKPLPPWALISRMSSCARQTWSCANIAPNRQEDLRMQHTRQRQYASRPLMIFLLLAGLLLQACGGATPVKTYSIGVVNYYPVLESVLTGFKAQM